MSKRGSGEAGKRGGSFVWRGVARCAVASPLPRFPAAPLWAALVLLTSVPGSAAAQSSRCVFQIDNVDRQGNVSETTGGTNYFAGGNVRLSCRGQQVTMQSDSVAAF